MAVLDLIRNSEPFLRFVAEWEHGLPALALADLTAEPRRVAMISIVPANCSQTFDTPLALARQIGALPHDGDLLHLIFLYSMQMNGIEVVRAIR